MRVTITVTAAQLTPYLGRGRKTGSALVRDLGLTSRGRPISHIYIYCPWLARRYAVRRRHRILRGPPKAAVLGANLSTGCGGN